MKAKPFREMLNIYINVSYCTMDNKVFHLEYHLNFLRRTLKKKKSHTPSPYKNNDGEGLSKMSGNWKQ